MSITVDGQQFHDTVQKCVDCRQDFDFSAGEAQFFHSKGFTAPKRCKTCRAANRAAKERQKIDGGYDGPDIPRVGRRERYSRKERRR